MKDHFECLFLPLFYTALWFVIHYLVIGMNMPFYIAFIPPAYGFGHFLACRQKGHISLSADSVAIPLTISIAFIVGSIEIMTHIDSKPEALVELFTAFGTSLMGAHMIVLVSVYLYEKIKFKF